MLNFIFKKNPFVIKKFEKKSLFFKYFLKLCIFHSNKCVIYKKILLKKKIKLKNIKKIEDAPFLPTTIFKKYDLNSIVNKKNIYKILYSSGTTNQIPSKIFLDKKTSQLQTKVLAATFKSFVQAERLPMIVADSKDVVADRNNFTARGAGIQGFSMFSSDTFFLFNNKMNINIEAFKDFLAKYKNKNIFFFGFTSIIWNFFYKYYLNNNINLNLSNIILIHGGGWKKMQEEKIDNNKYNFLLNQKFNIKRIYNYYGMVEQVGSIYFECEKGYFHTSIFNDVLIRKEEDLSLQQDNNRGIIQVLSLLPHSYPGHSILTEDRGEIFKEEGCKCGRSGKIFKIYGRSSKSEIRGCSDTYE